MTVRGRAVAALVAMLSLAPGCSDELTIGDVCEDTFSAIRQRYADCGQISLGQVDACLEEGIRECCEQADCDDEAAASREELDQCVADLEALTCTAFEQQMAPQSCFGIAR